MVCMGGFPRLCLLGNVTATYSGDATNAPSTSEAIAVVVSDPAPPVVVTPPPATSSGGGGVTGAWELLALTLLVWRQRFAAIRPGP